VLALPFDRPRPPIRSFRGDSQTRLLPRAVLENLRRLARQEGATLFMVLAAAFSLLLGRLSGEEDVVVGTAFSGRDRDETTGLIGLFVNTLPLRIDLRGGPSFRELLRRAREAALGALAHQDLPFEALVEVLKPQRSLAHTPVFQSTIVLQNTPAALPELPGVTVAGFLLQQRTARFDLSLSLLELPVGLGAELTYDRDLFDAASARRLLRQFETLLARAAAEPDREASDLEILDDEERRQIMLAWNATETEFPRDESIAALFEKQAHARPGAVAVTSEAESIAYGALNTLADALAEELTLAGIGRDRPVAVGLERGIPMIVAWLGILKAGGAYVPIAPGYPPARRRWMLEDSGASVLIADTRWREKNERGVRFIDIGAFIAGRRPRSSGDGQPLRRGSPFRHGAKRRDTSP
jgi:non-ribosomal peptide synthetase component F